nr:ribonuclease H-like domain-containing protein [Tanacetum cinerariifolium]
MPPKLDFVFYTAPIAVEIDHSAFTVQLSTAKPIQNLSHTNRSSAPIIEEWVLDSEDKSETTATQIAPSFVQSTKQVKPPRHSVQPPLETSIPIAAPKPASPKSNSSGKRRNRKACFVCKSVTQPRPTHLIVTKSKSPIRRHITRSPSPKTSNSPPRVTAVRAPVVSVAQGMQGKWVWRPKCPILDHVSRTTSASITLKRASEAVAPGQLRGAEVRRRAFLEIQIEECKLANCSISRKREPIPKSYLENDIFDKGVIDSGFSRYMKGKMSYLSDFEELNVGYVAFGGNPKGGKISGKGKIKIEKAGEEIDQQYVLFLVRSFVSTNPHNTDGDAAFDEKEPEFDEKKPESEVNVSTSKLEDFFDNRINEVNVAGLEDITYSDDEDDVGAEADFNISETSITEPKRVHQALKDPSWIEAIQEELLQFKMQKVWVLVNLPH